MPGEELPKSIPRKAGQNIIPMTMRAISPVPPMPMEEPLPIAITAWGQVHEVIDQEGNGEFLYCDEEGRREMQIGRNGNVKRYHYTIDGEVSYQRAEDKKADIP